MSSTAVAPAAPLARATRSRCVLVLLTGTAAAGGMAAVLVEQLWGPLHAAAAGSGVAATWSGRPDRALVALCLVALLLAVLGGWLQAVAAVREAWLGAAPGRGGAVRRLVLAGCGVALTGALATVPAYADPPGDPHPLTGLPMPDRATGSAPPAPGAVVVHVGDSLWSLADRRLGPGATDAAVALESRRLYRANRAVVGADPDLIHPGQRLELPGPATRAPEELQ